MNKKLSRRTFLGGAVAATVFNLVPRHVLGGTGNTPPSEKLNVAGIGAGGQANHDLTMTSRFANIVALCDVDDARAAEAYNTWPNATKYKDYRVMLEKEKGIDAVVVATPDHIHAPAAIMAMDLGKHVYVEKPMAHSIYETRKLMEAAKRNNVMTQMGNQGHSAAGCYIAKSWVEDGIIGDVTEVHCWTNRPIWPQGVPIPTDNPPVPATLDWNLWLGPAKERPYSSAYCPRNWRGWLDFGTGALGDMGCHILDTPFLALGLGAPTRISAESSGMVDGQSYPAWSVIRYEFPKRGKMPPVTLTWHDGGKEPPRPEELEEGRRMGDENGGGLFIGTKGKLWHGTYGSPVRLIPDAKTDEYKKPPRPDKMSGHQEGWLESCKTGKPATSNFDYAGPLTEMVLLGNIALVVGKPIEWDGEKMQVTNIPEANALLTPTFREGWKV
jgi:predicted dehydrogenase